MRICKETASTNEVYVRAIEAAPEPLCLLASKQQLVDLERFCTGEKFTVMSVDPTFNLGSFYVTPITYQNLLVFSNSSKNAKHPILIGPVLIHQTKTFHAFYYFASSLIRFNPSLKNIRSFGTDGESELIKAFNYAFLDAVHLRCTNHLRQNVKDKLRIVGITQNAAKEFIGDIFGIQLGTHMQLGLIDSEDSSVFDAALSLREKWNNLERSCVASKEPYGLQNTMHQSLKPPFYHLYVNRHSLKDILLPTSVSPLIMSLKWKLIGRRVHYQCLQITYKILVEGKILSIKIVLFHVVNGSLPHNNYSCLQVPESDWFYWTKQQKEAHIRKVMTFVPILENISVDEVQTAPVANFLDIDPEKSQ